MSHFPQRETWLMAALMLLAQPLTSKEEGATAIVARALSRTCLQVVTKVQTPVLVERQKE